MAKYWKTNALVLKQKQLPKIDYNKERNILLDELIEIDEQAKGLLLKYREFLGKYQEMRRQHSEIYNKLMELHKKLKDETN